MKIGYLSLAVVLISVAACRGPGEHGMDSLVRDCGSFSYGLSMAEVPDAAITCFVDATRSGRSARLMVTRSTDEGDPVPVTWTSDVAGTVSIETDTREAQFGWQGLAYQTCRGTSAAPGRLVFAQCSALPDRNP